MASITGWFRLEPRSRLASLQTGLQARVHDPLWMLTRQWQVGEFQAQDGGSPVSVRVRGTAARLSRYHAGPLTGSTVTGEAYDGTTPLETLVEREPTEPNTASESRTGGAAEAGAHFLRLLEAAGAGSYRAAYVDAYPLGATATPAAGTGARFLRVLAGRTVDGARLYADLDVALRTPDQEPALPAAPTIAPEDVDLVTGVARSWLEWFDQRYPQPAAQDSSAWIPERMEYAFSVSARGATGENVLTSVEYPGGRLDWYHFDRADGVRLGGEGDPAGLPITRTVIPGRVSFRGMPDSRWWAFEDSEADLGAAEVGSTDLGRMLLLQYALGYSDDWYTVPIELPVGTLLEIGSVVVTDSFGVRTRIRPFHDVDGPEGAWRMYVHTVAVTNGILHPPAGDRIFLPPVLGTSLESAPIEEVHLLRDEMANLAWAVEHRVEDARGRSYDRHEHFLANRPDPRELLREIPDDADMAYRLLTPVPEHWIPLVPVLDPETNSVRLRRGAMLRHTTGGNGENATARAAGRILVPDRDLRLFDEEVPRAGAHVTRAYQLARWIDGSTHLWTARRKRPGRGEGWSGLRFDVLEVATPSAPQAGD